MQDTSDPHKWNHQSFGLKPGDRAYLVDDVHGFGCIHAVIVGNLCEDGHGYEATSQTEEAYANIHTCNFYLTTKMSAAKIYARTIVAKCLASAKTEQTALSRKIQYLTEMTNYLRN